MLKLENTTYARMPRSKLAPSRDSSSPLGFVENSTLSFMGLSKPAAPSGAFRRKGFVPGIGLYTSGHAPPFYKSSPLGRLQVVRPLHASKWGFLAGEWARPVPLAKVAQRHTLAAYHAVAKKVTLAAAPSLKATMYFVHQTKQSF